jgi:two-component system, chemotaxis family, protein-glutamate methylesterase/glutaminase
MSPIPASLNQVIAIGASTGGPQALSIVIKGLGPALRRAAVFVVLHIPAEFTEVVAKHIQISTGFPARIARQGETIEAGQIYFSPGAMHMSLARVGEAALVVLGDGPPQNYCKPSVDILFRSAARCFGNGVVGIMLTGMGSDGLEGSRAIVDAGGKIIAQDAASSTVWGMPGAVVGNGLAHAVLPVDKIAAAACSLLTPRTNFRENVS